jgi:HEPN domain-containing protein
MRDKYDHAREWLNKGDSDLVTVRKLLAAEGPYDTATFHAQQAAEKYLKGVLAFAEEPIPRTQNLELLVDMCVRLFPRLELDGLDLASLTRYAVEGRYDFDFWPDESETANAFSIAQIVRDAVVAVLPANAIPERR